MHFGVRQAEANRRASGTALDVKRGPPCVTPAVGEVSGPTSCAAEPLAGRCGVQPPAIAELGGFLQRRGHRRGAGGIAAAQHPDGRGIGMTPSLAPQPPCAGWHRTAAHVRARAACSARTRRAPCRSGSRPASRVLYTPRERQSFLCATVADGLLKRPTRSDAGHAMLPYSVLLRVGLPCRAALSPHAVRSYRTVSPLPDPGGAIGGLLSVALSVGSRRPGVTWHPALWSPDFPRATCAARDCPADSARGVYGRRSVQWLYTGAERSFLAGVELLARRAGDGRSQRLRAPATVHACQQREHATTFGQTTPPHQPRVRPRAAARTRRAPGGIGRQARLQLRQVPSSTVSNSLVQLARASIWPGARRQLRQPCRPGTPRTRWLDS